MTSTVTDITYLNGYRLGLNAAAIKVRETFEALPATADNVTRDLILDLYNDIIKTEWTNSNED